MRSTRESEFWVDSAYVSEEGEPWSGLLATSSDSSSYSSGNDSTSDFFGSVIQHDGNFTPKRRVFLQGFCDHNPFTMDRKWWHSYLQHQTFKIIYPAADCAGTKLYYCLMHRTYYAIDTRDERFQPLNHGGLWVDQTIRVLGTKAQLREAGIQPDSRTPVNALGYISDKMTVEGFFVKGRGYRFPDHGRFGLDFTLEKPNGCVTLTIDLSESKAVTAAQAGFDPNKLTPWAGVGL